jgi:putative acetyltransferase
VTTTLRPESEADAGAIARVHRAAFGRDDEAGIVERLRADGDLLGELSLVAELDGAVVGHVALSRASLDGRAAVALGPIGVLPERQGSGVGAALMEACIRRAHDAGEDVVVLLGHPSYYPRFGFVAASRLAITPPFDVPDDVFMALELRPGGAGEGGAFTYPPAFGPSVD